jgi:hypothetical protein
MKEIQLTRGYFTLVDDKDFEFLSQLKWYAAIDKSGNVYAVRNSLKVNKKRKLIYMHRVLLNATDGLLVDHIDGNSLNNSRSNLRMCTNAQNMRNRGRQINNSTGFCGVVRRGDRFIAKIQVHRKDFYLGSFLTPEEAARAYDAAVKIHHGEFANLNFKDQML